MYTDDDLRSFYNSIQKHCELTSKDMQGTDKIYVDDYTGERFVDFEIVMGAVTVELIATVDPYKADEFRVEAVVGDKEIDTIFTDGEPMKKDFHTFGVIDTIAATVTMLGE